MATEAHFVGAPVADSLLGDDGSFGRVGNRTFEPIPETVLAFVGMTFEAEIASGPGVLAFSRDRRDHLAAAAAGAVRLGYRGIVSFGVAGGLMSGLRAGDWVVASAIVDPNRTRATDKAWSKRLCDAIPRAHYGPVIGVDTPVAHPAKKRELHRATGAAAVDMESHVVADLAAAHGLAFTALRVIVDPADRQIPSAALAGMHKIPRADGVAVLRELMARPAQLPLLARITWEAFIARSAMQRVRRLLGPHFGFTDLGLREFAPSGLADDDLLQADVAPYRSPA